MSNVRIKQITPSEPKDNKGTVVPDPMMPGAGPVRVKGDASKEDKIFSQIQAKIVPGDTHVFTVEEFDGVNALNSEYQDPMNLSAANWEGLVPDAIIGQRYSLGLLATWQKAGEPDETELHTERFDATGEKVGAEKGTCSHLNGNPSRGVRVADGWWFFDLPVNVPLPGNRLEYPDGTPLRAYVVECYATDVLWYRSREYHRPIRSPLGHSVVCTDHNRGIRGLIESGIYLRQPNGVNSYAHQLAASASEATPVNLAVDLTRDIHVFVNAKYSKLYPNLGRIGLMLRVS